MKDLNKKQENEILKLQKLGIDTTEFEKGTTKEGILRELRLGYEQGLDMSPYYKKGYKLRQWQLEQIRYGLGAGVDVSSFNKKDMVPEIMANYRLWLETTTPAQQLEASTLYKNYKEDILLRRLFALRYNNRKSLDLSYVLKDYNYDCTSCYFFNNHMNLLRALILLGFDSKHRDEKTFSTESNKLLNDFDKYFDKLVEEQKKTCNEAVALHYVYVYKTKNIKDFFTTNLGISLFDAYQLFKNQEPITEYKKNSNTITNFEEHYFNIKRDYLIY